MPPPRTTEHFYFHLLVPVSGGMLPRDLEEALLLVDPPEVVEGGVVQVMQKPLPGESE
jgi:hypothetical protein